MIAPAVTLVEKVLLARIYRMPILAGPFSTMPILQDVISVEQCSAMPVCKNANFTNADLDPSDYGPANFSDANLDGANFTGASMNGVVLEYASQNGTNFTNAILSNALPGLYIKLSSFDVKKKIYPFTKEQNYRASSKDLQASWTFQWLYLPIAKLGCCQRCL